MSVVRSRDGGCRLLTDYRLLTTDYRLLTTGY